MTRQPLADGASALRPQLESLHRLFESEIRQVDREIVAFLDQFEGPQTHYGMIRYHFGYAGSDRRARAASEYLPRGKRLRAIICMLFCRMFKLEADVAAVVMTATEIMHSASLAHDDIEDQDSVRWGRPTLHALFGLEQAINAGDAMIGMVYQLLLRLRSNAVPPDVVLEVIEVFNTAHLRMCEGQHLDLQYRFFNDVALSDYLDMVCRKTASPCVCIADAISTLARVPASRRQALGRFGQSLGMLYQICDDMRGIWAAPEALGRQIGQDISQERSSLPLLYAYQHGSPELRACLLHKDAPGGALPEERLAFVRDQMTACGARTFCRDQAATHYAEALEALDALDLDCREMTVLRGILDACVASVEIQLPEPA